MSASVEEVCTMDLYSGVEGAHKEERGKKKVKTHEALPALRWWPLPDGFVRQWAVLCFLGVFAQRRSADFGSIR